MGGCILPFPSLAGKAGAGRPAGRPRGLPSLSQEPLRRFPGRLWAWRGRVWGEGPLGGTSGPGSGGDRHGGGATGFQLVPRGRCVRAVSAQRRGTRARRARRAVLLKAGLPEAPRLGRAELGFEPGACARGSHGTVARGRRRWRGCVPTLGPGASGACGPAFLSLGSPSVKWGSALPCAHGRREGLKRAGPGEAADGTLQLWGCLGEPPGARHRFGEFRCPRCPRGLSEPRSSEVGSLFPAV